MTLNVEDLDPGVRRLVVWLNDNGFTTTDSGDGVSKDPEARVFEVPHVFMRVDFAHDLISESLRLLSLLDAAGLTPDPGTIQCTYDPADGIALIGLYGINDERLFGAGRND